LGKKAVKKNRFSINSPVDSYKHEFLKNAELTYLSGVIKDNAFVFGSQNKICENNNYNNNVFLTDGLALTNTFLKAVKKSFFIESKTGKIANNHLFSSFSTERLLKQSIFKKSQVVVNTKNNTDINDKIINFVKQWDTTNNEAYDIFVKRGLLSKKNSTVIQHPDLDDETRVIKRNLGKNTPIRILKQPKSDFFVADSKNDSTELLRFRFNEKIPTTANKPIKPAVYLTFKQKRYNQRNSIGKKTTQFFNRDTQTIQKYSGNPFLKNLSIIEDNFGNPTRQYRMVKKAKSRLDTTKVSN
jgi:hypothetical protein